ncbi:cytochrome P450 [Streptomyces sp. NPDC015127]|uniref:cytochrome P450 n=1 Tax=Streptomyces sp. NPDC015127 TaxID=3364939 RepID=UPI0036F66726
MHLTTCPDPFPLDAHATNVLSEGRRLRERGPLVAAVLDGGIRTWATAHRDVAEAILGGRAFRKNPQHWADFRNGKIPSDWGLLEFITLPGMLNEDGTRHRELRSLVSTAFTPRRVEDLRPRIAEITQKLITDLANTAPGEFVDLRRRFAFRLVTQVICHLFGLDPGSSDTLAQDYMAIHDSRSSAEEVAAGKSGVQSVIADLIAEKRRHPADDLTSALISATDGEEASLDDNMLLATLMLFLFAGHETTQNLITNAIEALADHPQLLALIRDGTFSVDDAVEETLRWNSPINTIMFRYAAEDVVVAGTDLTVKAGEAVVICVAATGRDAEAFGPDADIFDPSRSALAQHLAFGHGAHYCIGAPLARLIAPMAVGALFQHFNVDRIGAPESRPIPSYVSNSYTEWWTRLKPRHTAAKAST